jgi:agmatine deiminase
MMYDERSLNTVVVAKELQARHGNIYRDIEDACDAAELHFRPFEHTRNIWARDYMPIQMGQIPTDRLTCKFGYDGYGVMKQHRYRLGVKSEAYTWLGPTYQSEIVIDGGNIQRSRELAVVADTVFAHNKMRKGDLLQRLSEELHATIVVIPTEPYDEIGHSDGVLHFLPGTRTAFVNDYSHAKDKAYWDYEKKLHRVLSSYGIKLIPFPWRGDDERNHVPKLGDGLKRFRRYYRYADKVCPGWGYYINFMIAGRLCLFPSFSIEDDFEVYHVLKTHLPDMIIRHTNCNIVAMEGGLVNCVTMGYECPDL